MASTQVGCVRGGGLGTGQLSGVSPGPLPDPGGGEHDGGGGVVLSEANLAKKQSSCLFYAS